MHASAACSPSPSEVYLGPSGANRPGLEALRFGDVEEQAAALTGWNQDYLQLSAGAFEGEVKQLQGCGIKLFVERVEQSVLQTGVLPHDVLAVGIPLEASGSALFCGKPCAGDSLHVFSGPSGFEFRTSRRHTMLGIELKLGRGWLTPETSARQLGAAPDKTPLAGVLRLEPLVLAEMKTYLLTLFQSAQAHPELLSRPAVLATVGDFLLDRMAPGAREPGSVGNSASHWRLVQQACDRIKEQLDQAPTVAQLCLDLGVSRRTLQNGFQQVLDVSPLTYLKAVRLGHARRALKQVGSVTEAATAYGFWHFGHFSHDYQAMFGERPSQTLRRHAHT